MSNLYNYYDEKTLEKMGTVPKDIRQRISAEHDAEVLLQWLKKALDVHTMDEFCTFMSKQEK